MSLLFEDYFIPSNSVGPVSSLHDRACELYYALMGGTGATDWLAWSNDRSYKLVDYGLEHSKAHKHARYGRHISEGQYPEWSPTRPLHFVAHSIVCLRSCYTQGFSQFFREDLP